MGRVSVTESVGIKYSYSYDEIPPKRLCINHAHDDYEVMLIVSGRGRYVLESRSVEIKNSTVFIVKPSEYHCLMLEPDTPYERYVINFSADALIPEAERLLLEIFNRDGVCSGFYTAKNVSPSIISVFERLEGARQIPESERSVYMKMLLSELIVLLSVMGFESVSDNDSELGAKVIRYLNENVDKNISLDMLAKRFFVSKYYLCRAFKKHNGISVHSYINHKRVLYAKKLIESGETASGAAYKVGFGDYSSFYRAYMKIIGKSPFAEEKTKENRNDI